MPADFDAYHKWLGISPRERPPTYYRLLAIDLFEDDPDVIDSAANRQMAYLQELASGPNVKQAQKLLNEIAAARLCLLDPDGKASYDAQLKATESMTGPATGVPIVIAGAPDSHRQAVAAPRAAMPPARAARSPARPRPGLPALDFAPGGEQVRRTARRRKKPSSALVFALLAVALVLCAVTAYFVNRGLRSEDASTSLASAVAANDRGTAQESDVDTFADARPTANVTDVRNDSGIGQPGGDVAREPVQAVEQPTPSRKTPPEIQDIPADTPDLLVQAEAALDRGDVNQAVTLLNEYLADSPQDPWRANAEFLLGQAMAATNAEAIGTAARQAVNELSDDQAREIAGGKPHQWMLQFPFEVSQITDPRLKSILTGNIQRHLSLALTERLNRKPADSPPAGPKTDEPKPAEVATEEPDPETDQPGVSAERPKDPAELLAHEGLLRSGNRWSLAEDEERLREDLQQANTLYKKLNNSRRTISIQDRQQLALLKRQVAEEEQKIQAKLQEWNGKVILQSKLDELKKFEQEVQARRAKVDAAQAKVSEVDESILKTREELDEVLVEMQKTMDMLQANYGALAEDAEVLAAIESLGGELATFATLKPAQTRLQRMQKDLRESDQ